MHWQRLLAGESSLLTATISAVWPGSVVVTFIFTVTAVFQVNPDQLVPVVFYSAPRIASALLAIEIPSVCLSVTRRYCVKTTARSTVQFALSDSEMCLVF